MRLGAVDEHDPALDALRVVALGFQHRLGDHLGRIVFEAAQTRLATGEDAPPGSCPAAGCGASALQEIGLRTNGATGRRRPPSPCVWRASSRPAANGESSRCAGASRPPCASPRAGRWPTPLPSKVSTTTARQDRLARRRSARRVEGVEVLSRASDQLFRLTLGHLGPAMARQLGASSNDRDAAASATRRRTSRVTLRGSATHRADADCRAVLRA